MANEATPLPAHDIPSLPASPDPKRTKYTEPAANLTVACNVPPPPRPIGTPTNTLQPSSTTPQQPQPRTPPP